MPNDELSAIRTKVAEGEQNVIRQRELVASLADGSEAKLIAVTQLFDLDKCLADDRAYLRQLHEKS